jgi:hypothetical protein
MSDLPKDSSETEHSPAAAANERFSVSELAPSRADERDPLYVTYQRAMLELAFGSPPPTEELLMWGQLDPERRVLAIVRLEAMLKWDADLKRAVKPDVTAAAVDLKISPNRLYRMRRDWAAKQSLSALGVFAGSPPRRTGQHEKSLAVLSTTAAGLLSENPDLPVEEVVRKVRGKHVGIKERMPKQSTLRAVVKEQRRKLPPSQIGRILVLDCTAVLMVDQASGSLHKVFVVMDGDSGLVFGAALGTPDESRRAFARAAAAASVRLESMMAPWAANTDLCVVAFGPDAEAWKPLLDASKSGGPAFVAVDRHGRMIGRAIGTRLGRIVLRPAWTGRSELPYTRGSLPVLPADEMTSLLHIEFERHNAAILARSASRNWTAPRRFIELIDVISQDD